VLKIFWSEPYDGASFTKCPTAPKMELEPWRENDMPLSGEAIRLMNYVDDVSVTLRRVLALATTLTPEERRRVSEYLKNAKPSVEAVVAALEAKPVEVK
jgi:hypothetical protein